MNILVVEQLPRLREEIVRTLIRLGHDVVAPNYLEGVTRAVNESETETAPFDLIVADMSPFTEAGFVNRSDVVKDGLRLVLEITKVFMQRDCPVLNTTSPSHGFFETNEELRNNHAVVINDQPITSYGDRELDRQIIEIFERTPKEVFNV